MKKKYMIINFSREIDGTVSVRQALYCKKRSDAEKTAITILAAKLDISEEEAEDQVIFSNKEKGKPQIVYFSQDGWDEYCIIKKIKCK